MFHEDIDEYYYAMIESISASFVNNAHSFDLTICCNNDDSLATMLPKVVLNMKNKASIFDCSHYHFRELYNFIFSASQSIVFSKIPSYYSKFGDFNSFQ